MGTSALFSALNSLPMDEDEDGGDASEDDDYEGYSSEEGSPQTTTGQQKPARPTGKLSTLAYNASADSQRNALALRCIQSDPCPLRPKTIW